MGPLDLRVDRGSEVPLGTQLSWKLRLLVAAGALAPGERLPGIRDIAEQAGVNVNTVRAVIARLEEQGLLASEQGRGTFVAAGVQPDSALADVAAAIGAQARDAGVDPRELAAALYVAPPSDRTGPARSERRSLYEEIAALERKLAPLDPLGTFDPGPPAAPAPRILTVDELRRTRDELVARYEQLRREHDELRAANAAASAEEEQAQRARLSRRAGRTARWHGSGVWTGGTPARISWTAP